MKALYLFTTVLFLLPFSGDSQEYLDLYPDVKEHRIEDRFVKHEFIKSYLLSLREHPDFQVKKEGESILDREIYSVQWGEGETVVLMWSQMHGDESTATMALFDLFNFLQSKVAPEMRKKLEESVTLHVIPMLNPDGAQSFERRNALGIDLNRDALRLQNPESRILKKVRDRTEADFGFNLHDQSRYYSTGKSEKTATFSLLAPAYNYEKDVNDVRGRALQLSAYLNSYLQQHLPGQVGRYDDAFEPRAFGDNIQKWGTSTVLIECGGLKGDPEKQEIRRIHFGLFLAALEGIADKSYESGTQEEYFAIPENDNRLHDLLIKEVSYEAFGREFILDIAMKTREKYEGGILKRRGTITDLGDLSTSNAYREINAEGCRVEWPELDASYLELLKKLEIVKNEPKSDSQYHKGQQEEERYPTPSIEIGENPNFFITCDGERRFLIYDGRGYEL